MSDDSLQQNPDDIRLVEKLREAHRTLKAELHRVIVGQDVVIEQVLTAIFARGHCLLIGVPGLAKTLLIKTLAQTLGLSFNRIQFTPDLMPSDITGTEVIQEDKTTGERVFKFIRGPIFANVVLADEINRTPPKTQAALLESMQEVAGDRRAASSTSCLKPFFVLRHPEPDRARGHLPAARSAARPLHVQHQRSTIPRAEEELESGAPHDERASRRNELKRGAAGRRRSWPACRSMVRRVPISDRGRDSLCHELRARVTRVRTEASAPGFVREKRFPGAPDRVLHAVSCAGRQKRVLRCRVAPELRRNRGHPGGGALRCCGTGC